MGKRVNDGVRRPAWRLARTMASAALLAAGPLGCSDEVTGPTPAVETPEAIPPAGTALPIDPGLICRHQLTTDVVITGTDFSPVPIDIPDDPRAALPTVTLVRGLTLDGAPGDAAEVVYSGLPDATNAALLSWQSQTQMTLTVDQAVTLPDATEGPLPAGVYDVRVTNPNTNHATSVGALAVVDKPTLDTPPAPGLVCLAEGPRTVTFSGQSFLTLNGAEARFAIDGVQTAFAADAFTDCTPVAHKGVDAQLCRTATVTFAQDSVPVGFPGVTVGNPETAACTSEEAVNLRVVPPPTIDAAVPSMACHAEGTRDVQLEGTGYLEVDGQLPAVTLDGADITVTGVEGCADLETQGHTVRTCTRLNIVVPQATVAAPETPTLVVTNPPPAGCSGSTSTALVLVPPPTIADIEPPSLCDDGSDQVLQLTGTYFFVVDAVKPEVTVDGAALSADAVAPGGCADVTVPGHAVQACTTLDVTINPASVTDGAATVAVTNPSPAGCSDTFADEIPVVAPPVVDAADPALVCTDEGSRTLVLTGTGFLRVDGTELPAVVIGDTAVATDAADGCTAKQLGPFAVEECTSLTVTVAQGALTEGTPPITVTNPYPASCASVSEGALAVPPPVQVLGASPASVCNAAAAQAVTFTGTGFLRVAGVDPLIEVDGNAGAVTAVDGCTDLGVPGLAVESCTEFTATIDPSQLSDGPVTVSVTNPAPSGCGVTATDVFFVTPVPSVTAVAPTEFCSAVGGTLTLSGANFSPAASVLLEADGQSFPALSVAFVDANTLEASFGETVPPGTYDLTVSNAEGCADTLALAVDVQPTPLVFFVDPPVLYSGIQIQATIYTAGLPDVAQTVELLGPNDEVVELAGESPPGEPNRIRVDVPAGLAAGAWSVRVTSQTGCVGVLDGGLTVTDDLVLALVDIDPEFAWTGRDTAVTLQAAAPAEGEVDFQSTPRAYLNPADSTAAVATNLRAVLFVNSTTLTAVIPEGMDPGQYDLIVVNPDASVGVLEDAITITADPPPLVLAVAPSTLDANSVTPIAITGEDFSANATVELVCRPFGGSAEVVAPVTGVTVNAEGTVITGSANLGSVAAGNVCIVVVTNEDGTRFRFSAVSVKEPAQNLFPWSLTSELVEPRRAVATTPGRPTVTSRFLYAIGGDAGTLDTAKATVESASLDIFGNLGAWSLQVSELPAPRTFAGATTIGQYVYLVGGHDGDGAVSTVLRAQVLNPLIAPTIFDIGISLDEESGAGAGAGLWTYRVAAVFPEDDPANPGGEGLPGEVLVVQLPDIPGLELTLRWEEVAGASGYRVYRTPGPDASPDQVELLAEVAGGDTTAFTDAGQDTDPSVVPLPAGSLGVWHPVATLNTAREALTVTAVPAPDAPDTFYLYAFGGRDEAGTTLASYEFATVTVTPSSVAGLERELQAVSPFTEVEDILSPARAELGHWVLTETDVSAIGAGNIWILVGPGRTSGGSANNAVQAGLVGPGGQLTSWMSVDNTQNAAAGYAYGDGGGFVYLHGGQNGNAQANGISAQVCSAGGGQCEGGPPNLVGWNALGGGTILLPTIYAGSAQESAFFFVIGGWSGTAPRATVEQTVQ